MDQLPTSLPFLETNRKYKLTLFVLLLATLLLVTGPFLTAFASIPIAPLLDGGQWVAVVVGVIATYIAGNVAHKYVSSPNPTYDPKVTVMEVPNPLLEERDNEPN